MKLIVFEYSLKSTLDTNVRYINQTFVEYFTAVCDYLQTFLNIEQECEKHVLGGQKPHDLYIYECLYKNLSLFWPDGKNALKFYENLPESTSSYGRKGKQWFKYFS